MTEKKPFVRIVTVVRWLLSLSVLLALVSGPIAARSGAVLAGLLGTIDETSWTEWSANPIVIGEGGNEAYYPTVLYDAQSFSGHGDAAPYKMWIDKKLQYYTSSDGINWAFGGYTDAGLASVRHPLVEYYKDGFAGVNTGSNPSGATMYYRLWYWNSAGTVLYSIGAIRYAESADGISWNNDQPITQGLPVVITGGNNSNWNRGSYGPADVLYTPGASNSGVDWTFRMYYDGTTGGDESLGVAFSSDGIHWVGYDSTGDGKADPVLVGVGGSLDWDGGNRGYVTRATVLDLNGQYKMWYSGGQTTGDAGIGYATSSDGLVWTKDAENPVLHTSDGVTWRSGRTYTPMVIYDAASFSGNGDAYPFKMWFSGAFNDANKLCSIGYATAGELADIIPPVVTVPGDMTIEATSASGAAVTFSPVPSALDNVDGPLSPICTPASGTTFPLAPTPTTVTCTATDAALNAGSATFTVTVVDTTPPTVTAKLTPLRRGGDDESEQLFRVVFSSTDLVGVVSTTTSLNGVTVTDGQLVRLKQTKKNAQKVKHDDGILKIEAPSFVLTVTASDAAGNSATATAVPSFNNNGKDDDDKDKGDHKDKKDDKDKK